MTKEEIEKSEQFLDAYLGGNRNVSTLTWKHWIECLAYYGKKLQSENERLKAESKITEYKLLAGEACFETLRKVNDAFPDSTDMEWISVKTGLPEKTGWYLTFSEHGGIQTELYEFKESRFLSVENITHWMPLPKPPKQ